MLFSKFVSAIVDYVEILTDSHEEIHKQLVNVKKVVNDNKIDIIKPQESLTSKIRSPSLAIGDPDFCDGKRTERDKYPNKEGKTAEHIGNDLRQDSLCRVKVSRDDQIYHLASSKIMKQTVPI